MAALKIFELNVHYDGGFFFHPIRYVGARQLIVALTKMELGDLVAYIQARTNEPIGGLYYLLTENDFETMQTQESVNDFKTIAKRLKRVEPEPVKKRLPSERIVKKKLVVQVSGPGSTSDAALTLD